MSMHEVVLRIVFHHSTNVVEQVITVFVFQGSAHNVGSAEHTHRLRSGQHDVVLLAQSFHIACYDRGLEHTEKVLDTMIDKQSVLILSNYIVVKHGAVVKTIACYMG